MYYRSSVDTYGWRVYVFSRNFTTTYFLYLSKYHVAKPGDSDEVF